MTTPRPAPSPSRPLPFPPPLIDLFNQPCCLLALAHPQRPIPMIQSPFSASPTTSSFSSFPSSPESSSLADTWAGTLCHEALTNLKTYNDDIQVCKLSQFLAGTLYPTGFLFDFRKILYYYWTSLCAFYTTCHHQDRNLRVKNKETERQERIRLDLPDYTHLLPIFYLDPSQKQPFLDSLAQLWIQTFDGEESHILNTAWKVQEKNGIELELVRKVLGELLKAEQTPVEKVMIEIMAGKRGKKEEQGENAEELLVEGILVMEIIQAVVAIHTEMEKETID